MSYLGHWNWKYKSILDFRFRPLGDLMYLRIWHDNSGRGSFRSWQLNQVIILDCQTGKKFPFIVNKWLAVDEDDGVVRVELSVRFPVVRTGHFSDRAHGSDQWES